MNILGKASKLKDGNGNPLPDKYIVYLSEEELDKITGIAGKPHIDGRYKPATEINIALIYDKVKNMNIETQAIKDAVDTGIAALQTIKASIILEP